MLASRASRGYISASKEIAMPKLNVEEVGEFEVPPGKRLVNALSDEAKIDQLHACGGNARCTTCRVQFITGEPANITAAEKELLELRGLTAHAGLRLDVIGRPAAGLDDEIATDCLC